MGTRLCRPSRLVCALEPLPGGGSGVAARGAPQGPRCRQPRSRPPGCAACARPEQEIRDQEQKLRRNVFIFSFLIISTGWLCICETLEPLPFP